ncbi:MAG TPA: LytTR family DNA-binding domain-containing protein [Rhodanobacteraceae bacterium]|nr:LytTR family DNA-binding domain-containing protein [Rhodanobacteraceae bacterium]
MTSPEPRAWKVVIVDDEPPARQTLRLLLGREPDFEIAAECGHGRDAVAAVERERPDVLFLDVKMPGMDGFDVLREIPAASMPAIVFVTAYDRYAPKAFERHAVEYLLKPFTDERFADVVDHVRERLRERILAACVTEALRESGRAGGRADRRHLVVRDGTRTHVIPHDEIVWIEADDYYVRIHAQGRRVLARESLRTLIGALDPAVFARVHRSAIVNTRRIKAMEPLASGDQRLLLEDGTALRVSRTHRAALMRLLR